MRTVLALAVLGTANATLTKLATFDGAQGTTYTFTDLNDPVMGGRSVSTFEVDTRDRVGVFNGTCAIVPSLKAPGFCKVTTNRATGFADLSSHLAGHLELRVRSSTPKYAGFRVAFGAKNVPRSSIFTSGSFKAGFALRDTTDFQVVKVPFNTFSYDWSSFTGRCDTKDPTGQQHHCCSDDAKYCPTAAFLSTINSVEVWAEGAEGDFNLEIDYIGADDDAAPAGKTIADLAVATPDLSTLVAALKAGGLVGTLSGSGPFTVFAPTNEAFAKIPKATLDDLLKPENKAQLVDILTYHVAAGAAVFSKDLKDGEKIATVEGKDVTAHVSSAGVKINDATVTTADVAATNGVVHIIDTVLMPTSLSLGTAGDVLLVDFKDGAKGATSHSWRANNDPVMGGKSTSTVVVQNNVLNFTGTCAIVPSLKAPGFITAVTSDRNAWVDVSSCQGLKITHKSDNDYAGFRISFGRAHPAGGKFFAYGYKSHFAPSVGKFGDATIPFNQFTDFWDDSTGEPIHKCSENSDYCPDSKTLKNMGTMSIWAEGVEGDVHIEIQSISGYGCK